MSANSRRFARFAWLLIVAGCASAPEQPSDTDVPETVPPVEEAPPVPRPPPGSITIAAVGDIMLGTDYPKNILPDDDGVSFLAGVTPVLESADVAFGNLEQVLMDGGEPVKVCKNPDACFLFRSPTRYAQYLSAAGFDVMSLANNHARDFGEEGRSSSMYALDQVGIRHSGREGDVASWEQQGLRLAMIAYSPTIGSHSFLDVDLAAAQVSGLAQYHDIVLVSFHGGSEGADATRLPFGEEFYYGEARGNVVEFAHAVIDAGADLVLGHGPHVPRALEVYSERLVAYSLGNFATYYGISVEGIKGLAPILLAKLDGEGRFLRGRIVSNVQVRPGGPQPDQERQAVALMKTLTKEAFGPDEITFEDDGAFRPKP
ncbi:MAG: CapA family protein [Gammaproteobacteria bacterium]